MKYTILGFQQEKLIENNLSIEDAFILRTIKDMYSSATMEFKDFSGIKYMWINYTYLLEQIPIVGSKRNLKRKIELYGKDFLLLRTLTNVRKGKKGNFSYISPTAKLDGLQDYDLMTESPNPKDKIAPPLGQNRLTLGTESPNKDTSSIDPSIKDPSIKDKTEVVKRVFGEKVHLTGEQYEKLIELHGKEEADQMIDILDNWYLTKGNKLNKSDYHTMIGAGWVVKRFNEDKQRQGKSKPQTQPNRPRSFDAIDQWYDMTKEMLE